MVTLQIATNDQRDKYHTKSRYKLTDLKNVFLNSSKLWLQRRPLKHMTLCRSCAWKLKKEKEKYKKKIAILFLFGFLCLLHFKFRSLIWTMNNTVNCYRICLIRTHKKAYRFGFCTIFATMLILDIIARVESSLELI